ncbi:hypothetical protein OENI_20235 [Oenococcus oeni]|nr:hypothetical protein OENI_20235 [Oenococcus oeni]
MCNNLFRNLEIYRLQRSAKLIPVYFLRGFYEDFFELVGGFK